MNVTSNPLTIAAADVIAGPVTVWVGNVHVLQVELQGYIADTDTAEMLNAAGMVFCHLDGASDLETVRSGHVGWCMGGIKVAQLGITNGTLRIYIK